MPSELNCRIIKVRLLQKNDGSVVIDRKANISLQANPKLKNVTQTHALCEVRFGEETHRTEAFERDQDCQEGLEESEHDGGMQGAGPLRSRWSLRVKREGSPCGKLDDHVFHGKLENEFMRFNNSVLDDESIQEKSLEIKVRYLGQDNLIGFVQIDVSPWFFRSKN